nr:zinc finger protein 768-like isoform X5 [Dermacentor andersoni]
MTGKETARPYLTMSGGSCYVDQGASSAAPDLDFGRVPQESREAAWNHRENKAANRLLECRGCRLAFTDMEAFRMHADDHLLGKNHSCPECGPQEPHACMPGRRTGPRSRRRVF